MTRKEAIFELRHHQVNLEKCVCAENYVEALGMAIEALSAEPCDDCISRQEELEGIEELKKSPWATDKRGFGSEYLIKEALEVVSDLCVKKAPSVTPKQKMGRWMAVENEDMNTTGYFCSECDLPLETEERTPFCHNCGAKMAEKGGG